MRQQRCAAACGLVLGRPYNVQTIQENFEEAKDVTDGLELGFAIGGVSVLVVGLFLVYNALSVSVAERRHDIGILRSVGATRGQIARLFVGEAVMLGLLGSFLGVPFGYGVGAARTGPNQPHGQRNVRADGVAGH